MLTNQFTLTRTRALSWLCKFEEDPPSFTVYVAGPAAKQDVEKMLLTVLDRGLLLDELVDKALKSPTGAAIYYTMGKAYVVWPPFPVKDNMASRGYDPAQLKTMLEHDWRLGLVLVRLGHYAIMIAGGDKLVEAFAGTGLVHARHHKGGSSSQRFARHREKQMESFFTRVEAHAREIVEPHLKEIDFILYGGTRDTLQVMWKQCSFFTRLRGKVVDRLLSVREPKRSSFEEAIANAYMSIVFEITE